MTDTTKTKPTRVNVSGTISPELDKFIEDYRWSNRMTKSQVISTALTEWGKGKGLIPTDDEATEANGSEAPVVGEDEAPEATEGNDSTVVPDESPEPAQGRRGASAGRRR